MDSQQPTVKLAPQPAPQKSRRILPWRFVIPSITFVLGIILGVMAIGVYALSISANGSVLSTPRPPQSSDIVVQAGPAYITHLVDRGLKSSGMVNASNVQVTLQSGDRMTINGDDQLAFGFTRHFTIVIQPVIASCQLKIHLLQADLGGIPITGFVVLFEDQINQQLQSKPTTLPVGFVYCETSVRTDPQGLYLTVSAKPV
jgi:hypothetical protein